MTLRKPLVIISGSVFQLPTNDTIEGASVSSTAIAGSGLSGGGLVADDFRLDIKLAPNPSGLIFADTALGIDGRALVTADAALVSGTTALASGNAALSIAVPKPSIGLVIGLS
jgi:hypothetical protein